MIKAVIFDCFGVLTTEAWLSFKARYFGHNAELFKQASHISWQADRGLISYEDFMQAVAKLAGITPAEAAGIIERNVPDEQLFAYISELKQNYKLGLLSNVAGDYLGRIFSPEQLGLFDIVAMSFQSGYIKPERQAFEVVAQRLQVKLEECVFIDDQQRNTDGARQADMSAVLYHNPAQLRRELGKLLKA